MTHGQNQTLFVTKADKGGATLIMNFADVKAAIENELFDTTKFVKLNRNTEQQLDHVKNEVKSLTIQLAQRKLISESDKTLIAGLTSNNRPKIAPEYHPEHPYAYPLFKIHKLSNTQLENKVIPPNRLVHASNSVHYTAWKNGRVHISRISVESFARKSSSSIPETSLGTFKR